MRTNTTQLIAIFFFLTFLTVIGWYFSNIVIYLLLALLLSLAGRPIVTLLCKLHIGKLSFPRPLAAIIALSVLVGVFLSVFAILTPIINQEIKNITSIDPQVLTDGYDRFLSKFEDFASRHDLDITATEISEGIVIQLQEFVKKLDFGYIFSDIISIVASVFVGIFAILFLTYFSLSDDGIILKTAKKIFPVKLRNNFDNIVAGTRNQIVRYFGGVFMEMCIVGLINGIACHLFGVPDAVLIGVLSGLLNIIPYVGPLISVFLNVIISCTSMIPMSPTSMDLLYNIMKVVAIFLSAQLIDNFILQPFIYGKSVHAHPIEIFIVIMAAAQIGGIIGMVFAVPVYSLLRIVFKEFFGQYFLDDNKQHEAVSYEQ